MNGMPDKRAASRGLGGVWWIVIAVVAIGALLVFMPRRPSPTGTAPQGQVQQSPSAAALPPEVTVEQAAEMRDKGSFMLDVRQPDEWAAGHMPGSKLIPLDELESRLAEVPRDQEIVVVCHSGNRSKQGRDILVQAGYTQVASLSGGLSAWEAAGRPTVPGP